VAEPWPTAASDEYEQRPVRDAGRDARCSFDNRASSPAGSSRRLRTRNSSVERRARLLLVDAVRQRARRERPVRRLRSATLDRRVVGMCDSNLGDHDGESGRPGAEMRLTGYVQRLPGITVVSAGQAQIGRSQAQIETRIQHAGKPEIQQPSGVAGDGETRTRTGDTTISVVRVGAA
jgi:hypothetical protein